MLIKAMSDLHASQLNWQRFHVTRPTLRKPEGGAPGRLSLGG